MAKILVTGSNGQVGNELQFLASTSDHEWLWTDVAELDITNESAIQAFFSEHQPDFVLNTAAYTAVDKAESEAALCEKINVLGPELLAKYTAAQNGKMIQLSSDYVYDNAINRPLIESDPTAPKSVYAETKLAGDLAALAHPGNIVIRTSWVYSSFGHNFVKTMQRLGRERDLLNIVDDQIGTPTYARDLAQAMLHIVDQKAKGEIADFQGIYHYSNEGVCSWYDFALAIFAEEKIECKVLPIPTSQYPTPAKRPHFSVLNKAKIKAELGIEIPHWRSALVACLSVIRSNS